MQRRTIQDKLHLVRMIIEKVWFHPELELEKDLSKKFEAAVNLQQRINLSLKGTVEVYVSHN